MSGMTCHHRLWAAQTVERRLAWHEITALGLHARSDTVERRRVWHDITALGRAAWSEDIGRGMTSPPLDSTHG